MLNDWLARIKYNFFCLVMVDGSWDMGAHLVGSIWPLGGYWWNDRGIFKTYEEAMKEC